MKVIRFSAQNFRKLKAFDVTIGPDQNVLVFSGKNGQGKTSALDIIKTAIGGKKLRPDKPIREGQQSGYAEVQMDAYIARVDFDLREDGSIKEVLTLKTKDGNKFTSAQSMLDKIIGDLSFDPLGFIRKDNKTQRNMLLELANIDFDIDDNAMKRKEVFDKRTDVNRDIKNKQGELAGTEQPNDEYLKDELSVSELIEKLEEANKHNEDNKDFRSFLNELGDKKEIQFQEIEEMKGRLKVALENFESISKKLTVQTKMAKTMNDINTTEIKLAINQSEEINKRIRDAHSKKEKLDTINTDIVNLGKKADYLSGEITGYDSEKGSALANAEFPIEGLSVNGSGVIFNNIPFKEASSAEQLEVSISIAMANNPKLPIILVTDGSLLDSDHMKIIEKMADKHGFNVLLEKVDESEKIGIVIENGEIKKDNYKNG